MSAGLSSVGPGRLILVVDDDPDARAMLVKALVQAGYQALTAADGMSALALVDQAAPDLVVLDAVMPGLSGFETCRRLKARAGAAHVPVIFMTGLSETEHVVEGLNAGGVDYVTKPLVLDELLARIHVHLANAHAAHSARLALDVAGRSLFAADATGRLLWRTPQAAKLLSPLVDEDDVPGAATPALLEPMLRLIAAAEPFATAPFQIGERRLQLSVLGRTEAGEVFFRVTELTQGDKGETLRSALGLTAREAEVLVWVARGKSNKDISEILNISPRTVNKHLEQVFTKLGVENRAAAAAIATRVITAQG
ncbi:DNA-binding response regulator [Phenylobacterium sp.]|uniref:DNA-binding response regulator n=1 Tax=Phenylobacterium sp. TaxID=1871053 RepID=UPI002F3E45CB